MECFKDCPVLNKYAAEIGQLNGTAAAMESLRHQNNAATTQQQENARQLAGLPTSLEVVRARSLLQEAIVKTGEAQAQADNAIGLVLTAIDANQTAADIILSNCLGKPYYVNDPAKPGNMILSCASPGV